MFESQGCCALYSPIEGVIPVQSPYILPQRVLYVCSHVEHACGGWGVEGVVNYDKHCYIILYQLKLLEKVVVNSFD